MSVQAFWESLQATRSLIREIPASRFDWRAHYDPRGEDRRKTRSRWGGFIPDIAGFDAAYFGMTRTEAAFTDPRQRLLLMVVMDMLADAGLEAPALAGTATGVYVAHQDDEYLQLLTEQGLTYGEGYGQASQLANRIAYHLDLRGPSEIIDAQCAGSAIALHRAVTALRRGEIDRAIVAGANLLLRPQPFAALSEANLLSGSPTVKSFQAEADGHLRSEGVIAVLLTRLRDTKDHSEDVYALIADTAVGFNGRGSTSHAAPDIASHATVIERCYAGIDTNRVSYIEAQGMGNPLSDMAEWEAFNRALQNRGQDPTQYPACLIGTLKPMAGHMESAAALGGLLKIIHSLRQDRCFGIHNFTEADTRLDCENRPCRLAAETHPWPRTPAPRLAGLHAYGMSGNIAHILIEEYLPSRRGSRPMRARHSFQRERYWWDQLKPSPALATASSAATFLRDWLADELNLSATDLDPDCHFQDLGLDSLTSMRLLRHLGERIGVPIRGRDLWQNPTLSSLAQLIEQRRNTNTATVTPRDQPVEDAAETGPYPLAHGQAGLWTIQQSLPETSAYNVPVCLRFPTGLTAEAVARALRALARQHPILTQTIHIANDHVVQVPRPDFAIPCVEIPASHFGYQDLLRDLEARVNEPFDLARGPLLRVDLIHRSPTESWLLLCLHHIIFDGLSLRPLLATLTQALATSDGDAPPNKTNHSLPYRKFVAWERHMLAQGLWDDHRNYWRQQLAGTLPILEPATDFPRSSMRPGRGMVVSKSLVPATAARLGAFCRERRINPSCLFLALYQILLSRHAGVQDVIVGVPAGLRHQASFQATIGYFVNMLPVRGRLDQSPSTQAYLTTLQGDLVDAQDHAALPFRTLVRDLGILSKPGQPPVFQVAFEYQNSLTDGNLHDLKQQMPFELVEALRQKGEYELVLEVLEVDTTFSLHLKYHPDLYAETTAHRMLAQIITLIDSVSAKPEKPPYLMPILTTAERKACLRYAHADPPLAVAPFIQTFTRLAAEHPARIAVVCGDAAITFGELDRRSAGVAHCLIGRGLGPDHYVPICLHRSLDMVAAILGVLRAGAAFVPLEPRLPAKRLATILENCQAAIWMVNANQAATVALSTCEALDPVQVWSQIERKPAHRTDRLDRAQPRDLAYAIFTSGSTGTPKGVMIEHQSLRNLLDSMASRPGLQAGDHLLALTTISFDIAALELFLPLITGARLSLSTSAQAADPAALSQLMTRIRPTHVQATPSFWNMLVQTGWRNPEQVRVLCGGEPLPNTLRDRLVALGSPVWNLYGPTETTIWSTAAAVKAGEPVTIGEPITATALYILDPYGHLAPLGVPGELCIAGVGLARGYLHQPVLAALAFRPNPFDETPGARLYHTGDLARWNAQGGLEHLGRRDFQVKVRGHRVELGEIERMLGNHPGIAHCAVVAHERSRTGGLAAYLVAANTDAPPSPDALATYLSDHLPSYMIPSLFTYLTALPLTPNGKVDRKDLAMREQTAPKPVVSVDADTQTRLQTLWCDVLGRGDVGIHEGFFRAGGDSILAVILAQRISETFDRDFPVTALFTYPTIADQTTHLALARPQTPRQPASVDTPAKKGDAPPENAIAIIGMSCHFPHASDYRRFWENLTAGRESIHFFTDEALRQAGVADADIEDPHFIPTVRHIDHKMGFDPEFFDISPRSALLMNPQHRQLLMHAWKAVEDAGYRSTDIADTSVFMAASNNGYAALLDKAGVIGPADAYTAWVMDQGGSIPTMISHKLGFTGPSMFVHTNCSSSLAALDAGCRAIREHRSQYALVGAATLLPESWLGYHHRPGLNLSSDGHCRTFDAAADGMVPGEGVAVLLLAPAQLAVENGDAIHGLILGTGLNNDGRDKVGYYAPSVRGQAHAIDAALQNADIDPSSVGYIETHGTGTRLGDPIEVEALKNTYGQSHSDRPPCALGAVKANIGHLDTAAGLAGCIKAVLCLQHQRIPPQTRFEKPNPALRLNDSPFYVPTTLSPWPATATPRRAALSAFGIGGTNGHAILEEYLPPTRPTPPAELFPVLFLLSAASDERLQVMVNHWLDFLTDRVLPTGVDKATWLMDMAFTLQCGREPLSHRIAILGQTRADLIAALRQFQRQPATTHTCFYSEDHDPSSIEDGEALQARIARQLKQRNLTQLARLWVSGAAVAWPRLYDHRHRPQRVHLPTYPFLETPYRPTLNQQTANTASAPLQQTKRFQTRTRIANGWRFSSTFNEHTSFLDHHRVQWDQQTPRPVLPAAAQVALVRQALLDLATDTPPQADMVVLEDVTWIRPLFVIDGVLHMTLDLEGTGRKWRFTICTGDGTVHSRGRVCLATRDQTDRWLPSANVEEDWIPIATDIYRLFQSLGLDYGPTHRVIQTLYRERKPSGSHPQVLAHLALPHEVRENSVDNGLHPGLLDGALQACAGHFLDDLGKGQALRIPSTVARLAIHGSCSPTMWAKIHLTAVQADPVMAIRLYDDQGRLVVDLEGFVARAAGHTNRRDQSTASDQPLGEWMAVTTWDVDSAPQGVPHQTKPHVVVDVGDDGWRDWAMPTDMVLDALNLGDQPNLDAFVQALTQRNHLQHLLVIVPSQPPRKSDLVDNTFIGAQTRGVLRVFTLIKALEKRGLAAQKLDLTVITRQTFALPTDDQIMPADAAIHGLLASASREFPHWRLQLLDLDQGSLPPAEQLFPITYPAHYRPLARRNHTWYARYLIAVDLPETPDTAYRQGGVYVIIGGAGGLGKMWTRHVMRLCAAQVIWLGRRPLDPTIQAAIDALSPWGPAPVYLQADAGSPSQLEAALAEITSRFGPPHGIVHAALALADQPLAQMRLADFRQGLFSKLATAIHMARVFANCPLDFVLFFSSMISHGRAPGQANYAAGCAFLDAYAAALHHAWAAPVKVIHWGYWGHEGAVANTEYRQRMAQQGFDSIEAADALQALDRFLQSPLPHITYAKLFHAQALDNRIVDEQVWVLGTARVLPLGPPPAPVALATDYSQALAAARRYDTASRDQRLGELLAAILVDVSRDQASDPTSASPHLQRWFEESVRYVKRVGHAEDDQRRLQLTGDQPVLSELWSRWHAFCTHEQDQVAQAELALVTRCLQALPALLTNERTPQDVIFPRASLDLVAPLYRDSPVAALFNAVLVDQILLAVTEWVQQGHRDIRILEVGAGTGATSAHLLAALADAELPISEYGYSDVSSRFLDHAVGTFAPQYPFLKVHRFDVESSPHQQGLALGQYDVVVASNVFHATRDLRRTLRNAKALLRPGGYLFLNELSQWSLYAHLTFGLLEGWWLFEDARLQGCPALDAHGWHQRLAEAGFQQIGFPADGAHDLGHQLIVGVSDGTVRQPLITPTRLDAVPLGEDKPTPTDSLDSPRRRANTLVCEAIAATTHTPITKIFPDTSLERLGVDSILQVDLIQRLEAVTGPLPNTLLYEYSTPEELVTYLLAEHGERWQVQAAAPALSEPVHDICATTHNVATVEPAGTTEPDPDHQIAIIGIAGRFPGAANLSQLWENLVQGRTSITPAPDNPNRFGGFLDQIYHFDRQLFDIAAERALAMPPEVRLFLEITWETLASAGYSRAALSQMQTETNRGIGVFVGSMYGQYAWTHPDPQAGARASNGTAWQIPNQVSHWFNFTGPSLTVNTACSSSLTAIQLACQSLQNNECCMALAGGVNLTLDPTKFDSLEQSGFLASGAVAKSLGQGDGMLPGEGVGAVLLTPYDRAVANGDRILGVIRATAVNHGGDRQAFTAPDPVSQARLISTLLEQANIDPTTISWVEMAANGSALGDPIEMIALRKAFAAHTDHAGFCGLGSIKSNLGHLEAASGISQLAKVLLQMQHRRLLPTPYATPLNPSIQLADSPFFLPSEPTSWEPKPPLNGPAIPRRALINAFGAGGSCASLIVDEAPHQLTDQPDRELPEPGADLFVLAAATEPLLQRWCLCLVEALESDPTLSPSQVAAALRARDHDLPVRLAFVASTRDALLASLNQCAKHGLSARHPSFLQPAVSDQNIDDHAETDALIHSAQRWAAGAKIDLGLRVGNLRRHSLPELPPPVFDHHTAYAYRMRETPAPIAVPDDSEWVYQGDEPLLRDHRLHGEQVLLGVTFASQAMSDYFQKNPNAASMSLRKLHFKDTVVVPPKQAIRVRLQTDPAETGYRVSWHCREDRRDASEYLTATGLLQPTAAQDTSLGTAAHPYTLPATAVPLLDCPLLYNFVPAITLGPALKTVTDIYRDGQEIIAKVHLSAAARTDSRHTWLHPLIINSAFLAVAPLLAESVPDWALVPIGIRALHAPRTATTANLTDCWVRVRLAKTSAELVLFDGELFSLDGTTRVELRGCSLKRLRNQEATTDASQQSVLAHQDRPPQTVETYLVDRLKAVTGLDLAREQWHRNLMSLGLDSANLVALADALATDLNLDLDATFFFEHPSLAEVIAYFQREHRTSLPQDDRTSADTTVSPQAHPQTPSAPTRMADIAVIGMDGQFPGAQNLDQFWEILRDGRVVIREIPRDHWDVRPWYDPEPGEADKTYSKWGGFLDQVDRFDAAFFQISPREAMWMDPQNRRLLQSVYATAEDAGVAKRLRGSHTGVYMGICFDDYAEKINELGLPLNPYTGLGRSGISANRISYAFDLQGPSMVVNTACSSSLVALHYAVQALRNGECEMAFVGGANLLLSSLHYRYFSKLRALSPTGRCHTFDAAADGYVPAECVATVLLKPLDQARRDGDPIHAVIKGTAFLHGGNTPSLTAPSVAGETRVIRSAWQDAGIDPTTLSYIEAHGTGTKLGDPIEITALNRAFGSQRTPSDCAIGSVKANIGHAEGAAGIAGLLKVILQLKHRQLPPLAGLKTINPLLQLQDSPLYINRAPQAWTSDGTRRAGISSFGFSGAFAHAVVEEYTQTDPEMVPPAGPVPLILSAKTETALDQRLTDFHAYLAALPTMDTAADRALLAQIAHTLQSGREHMPYRAGLVVKRCQEARQALRLVLDGTLPTCPFWRGRATQDVDACDRDDLVASVQAWVQGGPWETGDERPQPRRIHLPTYPFAKDRYWIPTDADTQAPTQPQDQTPIAEDTLPNPSSARPMDQHHRLIPGWQALSSDASRPAWPTPDLFVLADVHSPAMPKAVSPTCPLINCVSEDLRVKLDHLKGKARVHLVFVAPASTCDLNDSDDMIQAMDQGLLRLFQFIKQLQKCQWDQRDLWLSLVTHQVVTLSADRASQPVHAAIHGFAGSLAKEFPRWQVRVLDLPAGDSDANHHLATAPTTHSGQILAWRAGTWYAEHLRILAPAQRATDTNGAAYRQGGVYVVIGGAGGLGTIWTSHLVKTHAAQVVWIGRRPLDQTIQAKIHEIAKLGPAPIYIQADAAHPKSLAEAYGKIKTTHQPIHGIVLAAVGPHDHGLKEMDEDHFRAVLTAKWHVAIRTAHTFADEPLDFMLFFSSIAALTRGGGMSGYTAGCRAVDALAEALDRQRTYPVYVVNWGHWAAGTGETIPDATKRRLRQCGIMPIDPNQGFHQLTACLASPHRHQVILRASRLDFLNPLMTDPVEPAAPHATGTAITPPPATYMAWVTEMEQLALARMANVLSSLTPANNLPPHLVAWWQESQRLIATWSQTNAAASVQNATQVWQERAPYWDQNQLQPIRTMAENCLQALPALLQGERQSTDVLFPAGSMHLVEGIYRHNPIAAHFNQILSAQVVQLAQANPALRILEVGGGTGATTTPLLAALKRNQCTIAEYCFTDISKAFLTSASQRCSEPYFKTQLFDLHQPPPQTIRRHYYDIIIATNCIHATRNIRASLDHVKAALRTGGHLLLNEIVRPSPLSHLSFGLLEGWWLAEDQSLRLPGSPILSTSSWRAVLAEAGFGGFQQPDAANESLGQQIFVAEVQDQTAGSADTRQAALSVQHNPSTPMASAKPHALGRKGQHYFAKLLAELLAMESDQIDPDQPFTAYGVDSIIIHQLTDALSRHFQHVDRGLLYEVTTIAELAAHFESHEPAVLAQLVGGPAPSQSVPTAVVPDAPPPAPIAVSASPPQAMPTHDDAVAVIGMSARFPLAPDLATFWANLLAGKVCITSLEMDHPLIAPRIKGDHSGPSRQPKYAALLEDRDCFDPLFFGISPREAATMDPQARLFLEEAWHAFEDAGYAPDDLPEHVRAHTGVFGAITKVGPNTSFAAMVNRVSHVLGLRGPSIPVDTMCSSALVALHQATEAIRRGELESALVGAVNLYEDPRSLAYLQELGLISATRIPQVLSTAGTGFTISEGVGAVLLKSVAAAERDGDHIEAVIRGSAVNHNGGGNPFRSPNPKSLTEVYRSALSRAGLAPQTVGYVELAAMGAALSDLLEVRALTKAYPQDKETRYRLGSLKGVLGHGEAVSGMAQFLKVVLQLKHRRLCPTLLAGRLNPELKLNEAGYQIQTEAAPWPALTHAGSVLPLRAGISALGAGGVNAHLILEAYPTAEPGPPPSAAPSQPRIMVFSARDDLRLKQQLKHMATYLVENNHVTLDEVAATLQLGRSPMSSRLAFVAEDMDQVRETLVRLANDLPPKHGITIHRGNIHNQDPFNALFSGDTSDVLVQHFIATQSLEKLSQYWSCGGRVHWHSLWEPGSIRRISLPTYPFEKRTYPAQATPATPSKQATGEASQSVPALKGTTSPELVLHCLAEVLQLQPHDLQDRASLVSLGMDSLRATEFQRKVAELFPLEISHKDLVEAHTIAGLRTRLEKRMDERGAPLSAGQKGLWLQTQWVPDMCAYNIPITLRVTRMTTMTQIQTAVQHLVDRHPNLTTCIVDSADGEPQRKPGANVTCIEEPPLPKEPVARQARLAQAAAGIFDMQTGPLMRLHLFGEQGIVDHLLFVFHHLLIDGTSLAILLHEFSLIHAAITKDQTPDLPPLAGAHYDDFVQWEQAWMRSTQGEADLTYWRTQLSRLPEPLALPYKQPQANQTFSGNTTNMELTSELSAYIRNMAKSADISLFVYLLGLYQILLARYSRQADVIVGIPNAGRSETRFASTIGYFVNMLPIRMQIDDQDVLRDLLKQLQATLADGRDHGRYPFPTVVSKLGLSGDGIHSPVFQTSFGLHSFWTPEFAAQLEDEATGFQLMQGPESSGEIELRFDVVDRGETIQLNVAYKDQCFEAKTIETLVNHYLRLVQKATPATHINQLEMLSAAERQQLLVDWGTGSGMGGEPPCITQFNRQVGRHPDALALIHNDRALTYEVLHTRSLVLADRLRKHGMGPNKIAGLLLERSVEQIIALLAVLQTGGCYLPLDPAYPPKRLAFMLAHARADCLIVQFETRELAAQLSDVDNPRPTLTLDRYPPYATADATFPPHEPDNHDAAYLIYTSGSTGRPKGVVMNHGPLAELVRYQRLASGAPTPCTLQFAALGFDVHFQEIFATLTGGGRLILINETQRQDPAALITLLASRAVARLFLPYVALSSLAEELHLRHGSLLALREVITAGETLRTTPAISAMFTGDRLGENPVKLANQYGPSESHVATAHQLATASDQWPLLPPIGQPLPAVKVHVLGPELHLMPGGILGEIFIGGHSLARGYHHAPALTAARFLPDPFANRPGARLYATGDLGRFLSDGQLEFLGRDDRQFKVRGFRVEAAEIENALVGLPSIQRAVITTDPDHGDLTAHVIVTPGQLPRIQAIRTALAKQLPAYMIPSHICPVEHFPLTPSGKLDHRRLPSPRTTSDPVADVCSDPLEQRLQACWRRVLSIEHPSPHISFFQLGGHSLSLLALRRAIQREFDISLPLTALFRADTIKAQADLLRGQHNADMAPNQPEGTQIHALNGITGLPLFCLPTVLGHGLAYRELAEHTKHSRLLTLDMVNASDPIAHYAETIIAQKPVVPFALLGYSAAGTLAFEVAAYLEARGYAVDGIILLDAVSPPLFRQRVSGQETVWTTRLLDTYLPLIRKHPQHLAVPNSTTLSHEVESYLRFLARHRGNSRPINADLHLIRSTEEETVHGWENLTQGSLRVYQGAGPHAEMLFGKYALQNAAVVDEITKHAHKHAHKRRYP